MGSKRTKSSLQEGIDMDPEDRISCLPGHVVDTILTYLPIREAVRTSVLSQKWKNKWYTLPNLVFDKHCVSHVASQDPLVVENNFLKIVDHVLLLNSAPINMFKLSERRLVNDSANIDRWILYLSKRTIKELVLDVSIEEQYKIPWCLFSCKSLQSLKLEWCLLNPPMTLEGFRNLKSIDLYRVTVAQDTFENLISNCPLLEALKLTEVEGLGQINIHAPNLKFFEIVGEFEAFSFDNTFQLTKIVIDSWLDLNSNRVECSGSVECSSNLLKFFDGRPHIQRLEIGCYFLKYLAAGVLPVKLPTPCIDLNFLSLSINFDDLKEISAALCLLRSSPNLRKLEIFARMVKVNKPLVPATYCWEDIFSEPTMPIRVRHVRIDGNGISGTKLELDFIKFLLLYSPVLEKMTVKPVAHVVPELMKALIQFKRSSGDAEVFWGEPL